MSPPESVSETENPPLLLRWRSSTVFIIATVWMSSFTDFVLYAMIVPVMPTALVERAGIPHDDRELWVSVLLMCEAGVALISCPIFGYLVDNTGTRRLPYLLGLILLGAAMILLLFAHSLTLFIIARVLQGSATAMVAVAGLALVTDSVSTGDLGQAIGYLGSAITLGFLLGPFLGGLVYNSLGYEAVFIMAFIIICVDLVMRLLLIEKKIARRWIKQEPVGPEEAPGSSTNGHYRTFSSSQTQPPGDSHTQGKLALFKLLKQPRILIASGAFLVHGLIYAAFDSTLPIFVESRYGWSAFGAGMIFLPSALSAFLEPLFGYISDKHGCRIVSFIGFSLLCPSLVCLRFIEQNSLQHIIALIVLLVLIGIFINFVVPALYVEAQSVLEDMEREKPGVFGKKGAIAQAFSIQTMAQFTGLFVGPLWGGFTEYRFGWGTMTWTLGLLAGVTAIFTLGLSSSPASETVGNANGVDEPLLRDGNGRD